MQLLFTATYAQPYLSGITDYIATVTEHLSQKNSVTLLTFQHLNTLPTTEQRGQLTIHRLPVHARLSKGLLNWAYPWLAWHAVKQHDKVFINLPQVEGIWVALAAKLQRKPITAIYHCELEFATGIIPQLIAWAANILARLTCQLADQIVVYTQDYADHSQVLSGLNYKITAVLPPVFLSVTDETFGKKLKQTLAERKSHPILGFSGRVSREKGLDDLFTALHQLKHQFPQIQLVCAGPYGAAVVGETAYFQHLQNRIKTENLPVEFLGRLSKSELMAFYKTIDVLVLPSTNRTEAFGLVQVEALSMGTPVITTDLPGVRVAVQMTEGGEIVPIQAPTKLTAAIQRVIIRREKGEYQKLAETTKKLFQIEKTLAWFEQNVFKA
jgi:glycosyltransferase involved in cell wall biosynthesis